ncbi:MAG: DUF1667 domain-containing protein [Eubacteriales bacterium]|nr:DUF1667 domain-containing protein [Eubacteriales bacterium]
MGENMDRTRELTCICCPLGCRLTVTGNAETKELNVTGNTCPRGADYAVKEVTDPRRIVTSTVAVENGVLPVVSVKTAGDIPKNKIFLCMEQLEHARVSAPVSIGDIVLPDIADTGVAIIATKNVKCK